MVLEVPPERRRVKGVNVVGLAKLLRSHRKSHPLGPLPPDVLALLEERILPTEWYPFLAFAGLVAVTEREILRGDEAGALQMGTLGGIVALESFHRGFVRPGDAVASLLAMRTAWPLYFDFGELVAEPEGARAVRFSVNGYRDVSPTHAALVCGWHTAAAIVSGAKEAKGAIVERPWRGAPRLSHRVTF